MGVGQPNLLDITQTFISDPDRGTGARILSCCRYWTRSVPRALQVGDDASSREGSDQDTDYEGSVEAWDLNDNNSVQAWDPDDDNTSVLSYDSDVMVMSD